MLVGEIADDAPERRGQLLDQRRDRDDLLVRCQLRLLKNVHHEQLVAPPQILFAERAQRFHRTTRSGSGPSNVQPKHVFFRAYAGRRPLEGGGGRLWFAHRVFRFSCAKGTRLRPTTTRSVLVRSPMIFFTGAGSWRTSVGMATI